MPRRKAVVLLEHVDKRTQKYTQIIQADSVWAVFYQGRPFNLKTGKCILEDPSPKYPKVSFSNPGHARNLARKLNKEYNTTDFAVYKLFKVKKP